MGTMRRLLTWVFVFGMGCSVESELGSNVRCADGGVACVASEPRLCIDVQSDPRHCGACGSACMLANVVTPVCALGQCAVGVCAGGFAAVDSKGLPEHMLRVN